MSALLFDLLIFEDIVLPFIIIAFFFLRKTYYNFVAFILLTIILFTNIVWFQGYHNWLIAMLPIFILIITGLFGLFFFPQSGITFGIRTTKILVFIFLFITFVLIAIGVFLVFR